MKNILYKLAFAFLIIMNVFLLNEYFIMKRIISTKDGQIKSLTREALSLLEVADEKTADWIKANDRIEDLEKSLANCSSPQRR